jgi:hypothetical protein
MTLCENLVNKGMMLRYLLTIMTFCYIFYNKFVAKYIFLILPAALTLLDCVDSTFIRLCRFLKYPARFTVRCTHLFYYQSSDKICDVVSYILSTSCVPKRDYFLVFLIAYRLIGVILFCLSKNSIWLVVFFDFVKEYYVYRHFFHDNNYTLLPYLIVCKIGFEYAWHKHFNNTNYVKETATYQQSF